MFNSALTSNPNNNKPLGIKYCGRFYPAVQDKSTGNFVVYINGIKKEFTFAELLNIQQAEQNRLDAWENLDKSFESQKTESDKWMTFYEKAKEKALEMCKNFNQKKTIAAKNEYKEELAYKEAKTRYDQIMSATENYTTAELDTVEKVHAEEYSKQMIIAQDKQTNFNKEKSFARRKEIFADGIYLSACHSAFNEALHGGRIDIERIGAKQIAQG